MSSNNQAKPARKEAGEKFVLMIGPSTTSRGGMASVCAEYERHGTLNRLKVIYLASFNGGTFLDKLLLAFRTELRLLQLLCAGRIAVLHVHAATDMSFWRKTVFCLSAHFLNVPFIFHLHSGDMPGFLHRATSFGRWLALWIIRTAAVVIVLSTEWATWLRSVVPNAKIEIVSNPVEIRKNYSNIERMAVPSILYLGRLEAKKGVPELLEAFSKVLQSIPNATLYMGGEGDLIGMRNICEIHSIENSVRFIGWVSGLQKQELLSKCWLFVLPSHFEGLPVGMLEAMACGTPVVGTRIGGMPGLIEGSGGGLLVDVNRVDQLVSALVDILSNDCLRLTMGQKAHSYVEQNVSSEIVENQLAAIYKNFADT